MPKSPAVELSQAELELKRRGRRRLIGAVTIGLVAIVVLPMVFDNAPRRAAEDATTKRQEIAISIPPREGQPPVAAPVAAPQVPASAPAAPVDAKATPPADPAPPAKADVKAEPKAAPQVVAKTPAPAPTPAPTKPAPAKAEPSAASPASSAQFVIQIGAFKDAENAKSVVARIKDTKLPVFTDSVAVKTGTVTRVRVGPFASREKADSALAEVKLAGIDGKVVPAQ